MIVALDDHPTASRNALYFDDVFMDSRLDELKQIELTQASFFSGRWAGTRLLRKKQWL